jgi:uncharacterized membrane protein YoaK (UPF0700 family)
MFLLFAGLLKNVVRVLVFNCIYNQAALAFLASSSVAELIGQRIKLCFNIILIAIYLLAHDTYPTSLLLLHLVILIVFGGR